MDNFKRTPCVICKKPTPVIPPFTESDTFCEVCHSALEGAFVQIDEEEYWSREAGRLAEDDQRESRILDGLDAIQNALDEYQAEVDRENSAKKSKRRKNSK